jgi:hypothetical protein
MRIAILLTNGSLKFFFFFLDFDENRASPGLDPDLISFLEPGITPGNLGFAQETTKHSILYLLHFHQLPMDRPQNIVF